MVVPWQRSTKMDLAPRSPARPATPQSLITVIAVIAVLYFGRAIFVPLALAILLSFVLNPAALLLRRLGIGRILSILAVIFAASCLFVGLGLIIGRQITGLAGSLPGYERTLSEKIKGLEGAGGLSSVIGRASETLQHLGREITQEGKPQQGQPSLSPNAERPVPVEIRQPQWQLWDRYRSIMESILEPLSTAAIMLVFLVFIMLQREDLRDRIIRLTGPRNVQQSTAAMDDAGSRLSRYFLTQTFVNSVFGCFIGAGLALIGVPNAVLFGAVAGLMRFVPFIGAYIAAAVPLILAAAIEPGWTSFFLTLALYAAGEFFVGQVIEPWFYGQSTGLSPFAVIVSATFWTWLWGPIGLVMAVPLTVCFVVLARHVEQFEFLYILLADAPALTPAQGFYQRVLAGNADEAAHDAEQYLRSHSLCQYYDDVAIPGLTLAHQDWERGALNKEQLQELAEVTGELTEDLEDYDDIKPKSEKGGEKAKEEHESQCPDLPVLRPESLRPDWRNGHVLVIGGRSSIDAAGASIIVQLLRKHGISAKSASPPYIGRGFLQEGSLPDTPLICVSYFGAADARAHLRFIARRLHRKQDAAKIVFCCWDTEDCSATLSEIADPPDAFAFASTLHGAIATIMKFAQSSTNAAADGSAKNEAETASPAPSEANCTSGR
jgi:predicted PurR-regulated permease PerM